jgi:hypothetical protein
VRPSSNGRKDQQPLSKLTPRGGEFFVALSHTAEELPRLSVSAKAMIQISAIHLMLKRLAPGDPLVTINDRRNQNTTPSAAAASKSSTFSDILSVVLNASMLLKTMNSCSY